MYVYHTDLQELFPDDGGIAVLVDFVMKAANKSNDLAFPYENRTKDFSTLNNRCKYHIYELSEPLCEGGNELGLLRSGH